MVEGLIEGIEEIEDNHGEENATTMPLIPRGPLCWTSLPTANGNAVVYILEEGGGILVYNVLSRGS